MQHVTFPLSRWMQYYALSYVWGNDDCSAEILIDGQRFAVTPNLHAAFAGMYNYLYVPGKTNIMVWIDAICINQDDLEEKAFQIARMDEVFSNAETVIVWLGSDADDSAKVMDVISWTGSYLRELPRLEWHPKLKVNPATLLLTQLSGRFRRKIEASRVRKSAVWHTRSGNDAESRRWKPYGGDVIYWTKMLDEEYGVGFATLQALVEIGRASTSTRSLDDERVLAKRIRNNRQICSLLFAPDDPFWRSLLLLLTRPWFERVWTFQEIKLARKAAVLCGERAVDADVMLWMRRNLLSSVSIGTLIDDTMAARAVGYTNICSLCAHKFELRFLENIDLFRDFLGDPMYRKTGNAKDYIYGYLGIMHRDLRKSIRIDYSLSDRIVYASSVRLAVSGTNGASFWSSMVDNYECSSTNATADVYDLPSWCPNFSQSTMRVFVVVGTVSPKARAAVTELASAPVAIDSELLTMTVTGVVLDTISDACAFVCEAIWPGPFDATRFTRLFASGFWEWLCQMKRFFEQSSATGPRCTFSYRAQKYVFDPPLAKQKKRQRNIDELLEIARQIQTLLVNAETLDGAELSRKLDMKESRLQTLFEDVLAARGLNRGRHFFITQMGRIGYAPKPVRGGQKVCYFPGGFLMKVVEERHQLSSEHHTLITSAGVDGLMEDAIAQIYKDAVCQGTTQQFRLR